MKVEKKKWWVAAFSVAGAAIIGLVVAIVVVVVNRGNGSSSGEMVGVSEEEKAALDAETEAQYEVENNEVMSNFVLGENKSLEDLVVAYKEKMDAATDEKLRAMFAVDYYLYLSALDLNGEKKDEILNALIEADNILQGMNSASAIITVAEGYGDQDVKDRYEAILQERAVEFDAKSLEDAENNTNENTSDDDGGVGVRDAAKVA